MGTKCNACDAEIYDISFMECCNDKCKKLYHLNCLAITPEVFEAFTEESRNKWVCPECMCTKPKRNDNNTPVRGSVMNKTFTPNNFVNYERGSRYNTVESLKTNDNDNDMSTLLREMRLFRAEIMDRLDNQTRAYEQLQDRFQNTEHELTELKKCMRVDHESEEIKLLKDQVQVLKLKNVELEESLRDMNKKSVKGADNTSQISYAKVLSKNQTEVVIPSAHQSGATKSVGRPVDEVRNTRDLTSEGRVQNKISSSSTNYTTENKDKERGNGNDWTEVKTKKNRYVRNEVQKGGSTGMEIQGIEKNKFLHVWRLKKDTTIQNLESHVKKVCGKDISVKIEKLKPKTERDYSSFMIGVPESEYQKLCNPEEWPLNVEFSEWQWFRKPYDKPK